MEKYIPNINNITVLARELRQNQTSAEKILWQSLKNRQTGHKFVRQKPFVVYLHNQTQLFIVDFFNRENELIIEVDGSIHLQQKDYDEFRSTLLKAQKGLSCIRFTNKEILSDLPNVLKTIIVSLTPLSPL